jgi:uncharacterized protein DUF6930
MPKKQSLATPVHPPDFCFVEQLRGEHPPSFASMKALYEAALPLLALRPWKLLEESQLIVVRQPNNEDYCYCSVMGAVGEFFSVHAYLGAQAHALFRRISNGARIEPADFLASQNSVHVEYVPNNELEAPDHALLSALGVTRGRGMLHPIFRASRPGFHPWFVTAEEATLLAACLHAVTSICLEVVKTGAQKYWSHAGMLPLFVTEADSWRVQLVESAVPPESLLVPARLGPETLGRLRKQDYSVRGVIELDYFATMMPIGGKNERKACSGMALAVDAKQGFLFPPGLTGPPDPGESLVTALCGAIDAGKALPEEIRLQSERVKICIAPVAEALGLSLRVVRRLPAFDEARAGLLEFMSR